MNKPARWENVEEKESKKARLKANKQAIKNIKKIS